MDTRRFNLGELEAHMRRRGDWFCSDIEGDECETTFEVTIWLEVEVTSLEFDPPFTVEGETVTLRPAGFGVGERIKVARRVGIKESKPCAWPRWGAACRVDRYGWNHEDERTDGKKCREWWGHHVGCVYSAGGNPARGARSLAYEKAYEWDMWNALARRSQQIQRAGAWLADDRA